MRKSDNLEDTNRKVRGQVEGEKYKSTKKLDREHKPYIFCNYCTSIISIKMPQYNLFQAAISVGMLQNMQATRVQC